ncbi:MAG: glycerol-3-phosphate transporter permease [Flavobacteriia bacterium]|nr:glycerol-3-phosphate transporter permease [Flavobacteriia bacterium]
MLLAPQLAVISLFFFWPAGQALVQSLQQSDAFGMSVVWVGFENFQNLYKDESYADSFLTTGIFSLWVAVLGICISLVLAYFADRVVRGALIYRTLLIWPYAVAPAVAGVVWLFLFSRRRFWTIQFPLLSPTSFFLLVINVVYAFFDTFGIVDAATKGGPGKDTAILVYKVYFDGFKALDLGGSAAQSVVLMVIVVALTVVQFRFIEKKVNY